MNIRRKFSMYSISGRNELIWILNVYFTAFLKTMVLSQEKMQIWLKKIGGIFTKYCKYPENDKLLKNFYWIKKIFCENL